MRDLILRWITVRDRRSCKSLQRRI